MKNNTKIQNNLINRAKLEKYVIKARRGNKKALENIVLETSDYIYYYCLSLIGDADKAQDAVQDIFLILFQKIDTIETPKAFLGWLKVVTANYCKNLFAKKHKEIYLDDEFNNEFEDTNEQINPENCIEVDEICKIVNLAVKALPDDKKECVMLYYYQQMTVKQIADVLEVKEGTVKSRLFNARKAIENELKRFGVNGNTLGGIAPMSCISYSLFNEAKKAKILFPTEFISSAKSVPVNAVVSQQSLASIASTFTFATTKTLAVGKIVAVAFVGVAAVGGTAAYTISHSENVQNQNASVVENTDSGAKMHTIPKQTENNLPETIPQKSDYVDTMFAQWEFTDEDIRTPINFKENEELNSDNNKNYVYDRMLNSVDYFDTLQSTYYSSSDQNTYYTAYCIDNKTPKAKARTYNSDGVPISYYIYDGKFAFSVGCGKSATMIDYGAYDKKIADTITAEFGKKLANEFSKTNVFSKSMFSYDRTIDYCAYIKSTQRIKYSEKDGENVWHARGSAVNMSMQEKQYFPQTFAMTHMRDFSKWKIASIGNTFGRDCFMISGNTDGSNNIYSFNACVDKQIGTLISLNAYDSSGNEVDTLITSKYIIDGIIDESIFDDIKNISYSYKVEN